MNLKDFLTDLFIKKDEDEEKNRILTPTPSVDPAALQPKRQIFNEDEFDKSRQVINDYQKEKNTSNDFTSELVNKAKSYIPFTQENTQKQIDKYKKQGETLEKVVNEVSKPVKKYGNQVGLAGQTLVSAVAQPMGINYAPSEKLIKKVQDAGMLSEEGEIGGKEIWNTAKNTADLNLKIYGLSNPALALKSGLGGAAMAPVFKAGENLLNEKPILEGVDDSVSTGFAKGIGNSGTTRLTGLLVEKLASSVPFLKNFTEKGLESGLPKLEDTLKTGTKKWLETSGKKMLKAAVLETLVETPIWAAINQGEKESYLEAVQREAIENLVMNVGMAGVDSVKDISSLLPAIDNGIKSAIDKVNLNFENKAKELGMTKEEYLQAGFIGNKNKKDENLPLLNKDAKFTYTPEMKLSTQDNQIETKFGSYLSENFDEAKQKYNALPESQGGKVINTDVVRELSPDYNADRNRRSAAVHEPASAFSKALFKEKLQEGNHDYTDYAVFTGGGTGAGKSSAIRSLPEIQGMLDKSQFIYDNNLSSWKSSKAKVENTLKAGKKVNIVYVIRDPMDAMFNGAVPRAKRMGRTVPIDNHVSTHAQSLETIKRLSKEYGNNDNVDIRIINNNLGKGNAQPIPIDKVKDVLYNKNVIRKEILNELDNRYKSGQLEKTLWEGFTQGREKDVSQTDRGKISTGNDEQFKQRSEEFIDPNPPQQISKILSLDKYKNLNKGLPLTNKQANTPDSMNLKKGVKPLSFPDTVKESETATQQLKDQIDEMKKSGDLDYAVLPNKQSIDTAQERINVSEDQASEFAFSKGKASAEKTATQMLLLNKWQQEDKMKQSLDLLEHMSRESKTRGQAIQILSAWGKLTPEGALRYAKRLVDKANADSPKGQKINLDEGKAREISDQAKKLQKMPEGRKKQIETGKLLDKIASVVPPKLADKLSSLQTMAQLLNPKTAIRNTIGNMGFSALENIKDVVASPIDIATSIVTGKRTKALPSLTTQAKGAAKGFKLGLEEALSGVDVDKVGTKYDLPTKTFRKGALGLAEKALNVELRATDKAAYQAAYDDSLRQQMKAAKVDKPTVEMEKVADFDGLYRTFQDTNNATKLFSGLKKALNNIGVKGKNGSRWGLGDMIIKYPKTPANILARAVDYSPAGFVKSTLELAKPLFKGDFNQKEFVESTSRALVGTAVMGTGAILHKLGIINGEPSSDYDINNASRERGFPNNYRLNTSALKRFVLGGFDPEKAKEQEGDKIVSYDWFQPQAINFAMGADIDANNATAAGFVGKLAASISSASNTLVEQPLLSGLSDLFQYGDVPQGLMKAVSNIPSSFVPTILNQVRQLTDNTSRNTYDPSLGKQALNQVKGRLPLLSKDLPANINTKGKPLETYQDGSNSVFNVFLNPSFVSKVKADPVLDEVMDIYNRSGETRQAPRKVSRNVQIINADGEREKIKLSAEKIETMQKYVGSETERMFNQLVKNEKWMQLGDDEKAQMMANIMSDIQTAAKIVYLGHSPKKPSKKVMEILNRKNKEVQAAKMNNLPLLTP